MIYGLKPFFCVLLHADELLSIIYCKMSSATKFKGAGWVMGKSYNYSHKKKKIHVALVIFSVNMSNLSVICNTKTWKIVDS